MAQSLSEVALSSGSVWQSGLDLISEFSDSLPHSLEELPIPEWHREELERRLAAADADPDGGIPWEEVRERLRNG